MEEVSYRMATSDVAMRTIAADLALQWYIAMLEVMQSWQQKMLMAKKYCDKCIFCADKWWCGGWLIYKLWQKWTTNRYQYKRMMVLELQVHSRKNTFKHKENCKGTIFLCEKNMFHHFSGRLTWDRNFPIVLRLP